MDQQPEVLFELPDERDILRDSRLALAGFSRNSFVVHPAPRDAMSRPWNRFPILKNSHGGELTAAVRPFAEWFESQPASRDRLRWALRDSLDELMDGQRTGRWCYQHLAKTEKTYLGTAIEVNLTKEFQISAGDDLDWSVAGADIDCKFSKDLGGWEIPMEMYRCAAHGDRSGKADQVALLLWMDDDRGMWAAGLLQITDERLRWKPSGDGRVRAYNRDNKRRIDAAAYQEIYWLWGGLQDDLPTNLILSLSSETRGRIFSFKSGQRRVIELFRQVPGRIIGRHTVLTVGQQDDAPKRARDARRPLARDGMLILGHERGYTSIAEDLELIPPVKGEWLSVPIVAVSSSSDRPTFELAGAHWALAEAGETLAELPFDWRGLGKIEREERIREIGRDQMGITNR